ELTDHRAELERWSESPVRTFSYPYGRSDDASGSVERALAAGGHEATFLVCARDNRWRAGGPWFRVSLQDQPVRRLNAHLHWLPLVRAVRARLRGR
ncbi:MAG: hypothetical protein JWM73_2498, partial [Solirubrobacterales bacterium]|nr:hypothetical protein [Solirubrobacterales bacterium]